MNDDQALPGGPSDEDDALVDAELVDDARADVLLTELGGALRATDPVPYEATLAARSAIAFRNLDAALAELTFDSSDADDAQLAGVRSTAVATSRLLTFEGDVTIELQVVLDGDRRRVLGQVVPMAPAEVRLVTLDGDHLVDADPMGRFAFDALPGGHVSLVVTMPDGTVVRTSWTVI